MKKTIIIVGCTTMLLNFVAMGQTKIAVSDGQKIHLVNNTVSNITQSIQGNDMEIKSNTTLNLDAEVKETTPDIHLTNTITRLQLQSEAMGNTTNFDSDKKEDKDGQIGQLLKDVIGKPLDVYLSSKGELLKNKKAEDASVEAAKNLVGNLDEIGSELLLAVPNTIKAGDTWVDEINTDSANKKKTMYSVKSVNKTEAVVSFTGTETTKKAKTLQGMDAIINANSSFSGEITVDIKTGVIKQKTTTAEAKGSTDIMGQSIPFTLKQTVTSNNK
ncbi:MAG: hypothetical protein KGL19_15270 [Bacteroidota bacterium]|nr:hypothetical protein [Bacteroidota bacterium]